MNTHNIRFYGKLSSELHHICFSVRRPFQPQHDKTNKMICAPSEDSDQPGYPPSLNKAFVVRSMGAQCFFRLTVKTLIRLGGLFCHEAAHLLLT